MAKSEVTLDKHYINQIVNGYLDAIAFTENEELTDSSGFSADLIVKVIEDVRAFIEEAGELLDDLEPAQIGHDFWLTRNGHGAGFWSRGLGEVGDKLTKLAEKFGEANVYVDDGGMIRIY